MSQTPARPDRAGVFPATRLSVVARTRSADREERQLALAAVIEAYWKPVYKYLRMKWRLTPEDAADLTQGFFTRTLEKDVIARYDPARARFRTYLRLAVDGFVANEYKAGQRLKRGGGQATTSLDLEGAEAELARSGPWTSGDPDDLFHREWVRAIVERAVERLRASTAGTSRAVMFDVFARYDLAEADGRDRPTYAAIAGALGLTPATVTNHLAAMRRDLRRLVLDALRELTASDEECEAEARRLFGGSS